MLFLTIILFVLILSILVIIHEFGHFYVAKRNGVKVEEFGWGFSPRVCGWYKSSETKKWRFFWGQNNKKRQDINDTIYSINAIPVGGFVKMLGEEEIVKSKNSFSEKSPWVRFKIVIAGVTLNFLLAFLCLCCWLWFTPDNIPNNVIVVSVEKDSAAEKAGIKQNDFIKKINNKDLTNSNELSQFSSKNKGKEVVITVERGNKEENIKVVLSEQEHPLGVSMADTGGQIEKFAWYKVPWIVLQEMWNLIVVNLLFLWQFIASIFSNSVSAPVESVSGPVGIFSFLYQIISFGWIYLLRFAGILSLGIAILNILPFPALDGGRLVFIAAEMIFKKKMIKDQVENALHFGGFIILLLLIVLVTYNDISKLIK